jgi:hypothetical protein
MNGSDFWAQSNVGRSNMDESIRQRKRFVVTARRRVPRAARRGGAQARFLHLL